MKWIANSKGITLIEVVVASVLLISVLAPTFSLMHSCLDSFQKAGSRSQMVAVGKGVIEETIAKKDYNIKELREVISDQNPQFKYNLTITSYEGSNFLRNIKVDVYEDNNLDRSLSFTTIRLVK